MTGGGARPSRPLDPRRPRGDGQGCRHPRRCQRMDTLHRFEREHDGGDVDWHEGRLDAGVPLRHPGIALHRALDVDSRGRDREYSICGRAGGERGTGVHQGLHRPPQPRRREARAPAAHGDDGDVMTNVRVRRAGGRTDLQSMCDAGRW